MNKIFLYAIIAVLVLIIIGGGLFFFSNNKTNKKVSPSAGLQNSNQPSSVTTENKDNTLSEQPNQEKFKEYFTEVYLAKLPAGAEFNPWKIIKTKIFSTGEQFCTSLTMKKQIPANTLSSVIYDVNAKQNIQPRLGTFPQALGPGNSTGCEPLSQPVGKYESKIYINDVLAVVLPFEVK